jgi:hypothetical protein
VLNSIDPAARDSNTNDVLEVAFTEALIKLLVHNCFHAGINFNIGVFLVNHFDALLDVVINTFVN